MLFTTHAFLTIGEYLAKLSLLFIRDTKTLPVAIAKAISSPHPLLFREKETGVNWNFRPISRVRGGGHIQVLND